jgi:hypothetical protein
MAIQLSKESAPIGTRVARGGARHGSDLGKPSLGRAVDALHNCILVNICRNVSPDVRGTWRSTCTNLNRLKPGLSTDDFAAH